MIDTLRSLPALREDAKKKVTVSSTSNLVPAKDWKTSNCNRSEDNSSKTRKTVFSQLNKLINKYPENIQNSKASKWIIVSMIVSLYQSTLNDHQVTIEWPSGDHWMTIRWPLNDEPVDYRRKLRRVPHRRRPATHLAGTTSSSNHMSSQWIDDSGTNQSSRNTSHSLDSTHGKASTISNEGVTANSSRCHISLMDHRTVWVYPKSQVTKSLLSTRNSIPQGFKSKPTKVR